MSARKQALAAVGLLVLAGVVTLVRESPSGQSPRLLLIAAAALLTSLFYDWFQQRGYIKEVFVPPSEQGWSPRATAWAVLLTAILLGALLACAADYFVGAALGTRVTLGFLAGLFLGQFAAEERVTRIAPASDIRLSIPRMALLLATSVGLGSSLETVGGALPWRWLEAALVGASAAILGSVRWIHVRAPIGNVHTPSPDAKGD